MFCESVVALSVAGFWRIDIDSPCSEEIGDWAQDTTRASKVSSLCKLRRKFCIVHTIVQYEKPDLSDVEAMLRRHIGQVTNRLLHVPLLLH
jgi:hypothetical protein